MIRAFFAVLFLIPVSALADPLAGTQPLSFEGDFADQMGDGIDRFLARETAESIDHRATLWKRDTSSLQAYEKSIAPNRAHLAQILGAVDAREQFDAPELLSTTKQSALIGRGDGFEAYAIRWP